MPLADFTIALNTEPERAVRVVVYRTVGALRAAAARHDNRTKRRKLRGSYKDTLGVCHRFEWEDQDGNTIPLCAIVRLAEPNLGVGIVSHEMAHAAVWINELDTEGNQAPLAADNDEPFCWLLGELVRQAVNGMTERGVYS